MRPVGTQETAERLFKRPSLWPQQTGAPEYFNGTFSFSVFPLVWESVGWYWEGVPGDQFGNSFWSFGPPGQIKEPMGKKSMFFIVLWMFSDFIRVL